MDYPLVSVIMPVYNVDRFVGEAIKSVLSQTYSTIEFLIIDDGSSDKTNEICAAYEKRDNRIRVIRQKNAGAAAARNHGMREAKGEYILFMDSDDTMHPQTIEILYNMLMENKVSMAMVNFLEVKETYTKWEKTEPKTVKLFSQEKIMDILCSGKENLKLRLLLTVPWCKLYHYTLLKGLSYPEGTICEDEFMINDIVKRCKQMAYMDLPLYAYFVRPGSVMRVKFDRRYLASMRAFKERIQCAEELGFERCKIKMIRVFMKDHIGNYCKAYSQQCEDKEVYRWLKHSFRIHFKQYWKVLEKSEKIRGVIFFFSPYGYVFIKKIFLHNVYSN